MEDTIAAISTAIGEGAIAIVRLSGSRAIEIADRLFVSPSGKPSKFLTHTIHFGSIGLHGDIVDQVMLAVMRAPRSYTTEDMVEINCHGGHITARSVLSLCFAQGARPAEPGEFTKRAFLCGRIDLTQAEAVADVIRAKTDRAHAAAARVLEGHLSVIVNAQRDRLVNVLAHIEAHIDFPEEDINPVVHETLLAEVESVLSALRQLQDTVREGKILREGIAVAIIGRPNVGKSSLMNALLGQERSIVTHVPGTTRDTIEETANIRGIPIKFTDTAGIRKARGTVEEHGVRRSRKALARSELTLHVMDVSRLFAQADRELARQYDGKPAILVGNKSDLPRRLELPDNFPAQYRVDVSALTGSGIEELKKQIEAIVWQQSLGSAHLDVAINERQAVAITVATKRLTQALHDLRTTASLEVVAQSLRDALEAVGEVVGKIATEDILDKVFSTFCIGK